MLKLILVPLDGSDFGEQALPMAVHIAERERAQIELVHVYESIPPYLVQGAPPLDPQLDIDLRRDRANYLKAVAERLRRSTNVGVEATLLDGPVAPTLVDHIAARHADLVVMATHGRGGLSRIWIGSVASDLMRNSTAPVMLFRPAEASGRAQPRPFAHVLIPLDGSPLAEEAIEHAVAVARDPGVEFFLFTVLKPVDYIGTGSLALPEDSTMYDAAMRYLGDLAGQLRARGFTVDFAAIRHSNPARAILEYAEESRSELIAMETQGRRGVSRLLTGGVTDKVARGSAVPVLVHRPRPEEALVTGEHAGAQAARGSRDS
jgi:nucleotide-binding universal stress UspA family protein